MTEHPEHAGRGARAVVPAARRALAAARGLRRRRCASRRRRRPPRAPCPRGLPALGSRGAACARPARRARRRGRCARADARERRGAAGKGDEAARRGRRRPDRDPGRRRVRRGRLDDVDRRQPVDAGGVVLPLCRHAGPRVPYGSAQAESCERWARLSMSGTPNPQVSAIRWTQTLIIAGVPGTTVPKAGCSKVNAGRPGVR